MRARSDAGHLLAGGLLGRCGSALGSLRALVVRGAGLATPTDADLARYAPVRLLADDQPRAALCSAAGPALLPALLEVWRLMHTHCNDPELRRRDDGRMRILKVSFTPDAVARVLHGARAPPRPPPPGTAPPAPVTRTPGAARSRRRTC